MPPAVILFLHDRPALRAQARAAFGGAPASLVTARHAEEAAARVAEVNPVLIVADAERLEAARDVLGALPADRRDLSLAAVSSLAAEPQAFQAGAIALMSAPISPAEAAEIAEVAAAPAEQRAALRAALERATDPAGAAAALRDLRDVASRSRGALAAWALYHAAALLLTSGQLQEALEELSALTDERPRFWRAHDRLAGIWEIAGDPDSAARHRAIARQLVAELAADAERACAAHPEALDEAPFEPAGAGPEPSPAAEAAEAAEPATPAAPAKGSSRADIVVADDSELVREMLADTLERAGYSVRQAASGTEAVELARTKRPDLMILDGLMPGKTGFDACKEIKDSVCRDRPPKILIFSAIYTKQRQKTEAVSLYGVDEVLAKPTNKPLDEAEILDAIRRHIGD